MTPRSLFIIIIKTIGLYMLIGSLSVIPQFIDTVASYLHPAFPMGGPPGIKDFVIPMLIMLVIIGFYILFFRLCFYKTDWIIDKLRLDQGFSEEVLSINIHRSTVLRIVVAVAGILIAADSLPLVFRNLVSYLHDTRNYEKFTGNPSSAWLAYYFIKFSVGLFLLTANRMVVNFIELKRKSHP